MTTAGERDGTADPLDAGIDALYRGPLDSFVARRDALAKEMRAANRRHDARTIKTLRKPKRLAWALNVASMSEPTSVRAVADAVASTVAAQSGSGDLRAGLASLREKVRDLAAIASRLAWAGEHSVDPGELADAIMAVIGSREAFDLLRAGRLVDIPEAGGIELLSRSAVPDAEERTLEKPATDGSAEAESKAVSPPKHDPELLEAVRRAEGRLIAANERLTAAGNLLQQARTAATAAERTLLLAQTDAAARRTELERASAEADAASAAVREAEAVLAQARKDVAVD